MTNPNDTYTSPLASRNASPEMLRIWSPRHKFNTWRRIWLAVAEAQQACGLEITDEQIAELRAVVERGITDEELVRAAELERELRHDVMAHVHCLGEQAPKAKGIIHLGMTSQDVVCNADLVCIGQAYHLILTKLNRAAIALADLSDRWKATASLGFTHYQPAQPVTLGRRFAGWASELLLLSENHGSWMRRFRGLRGATGTQASFLALFDSDSAAVDALEERFIKSLYGICWPAMTSGTESEWAGFDFRASMKAWDRSMEQARRESLLAGGMSEEQADKEVQKRREERDNIQKSVFWKHLSFPLTGQTYPRVTDAVVLSHLAATASVLHKIATDIRLLSNRKEIDEPFGDKQIGSSAMPYKRNPMKCERICGLTRFVMNLVGNAYDTAATQWLERTLDDSSNRRLSLPEAFLALDGALDLMHQVASGLVVHEAMVRKNLMAELPFLATENILMAAVKAGADRQDYHEKIRAHAQAAGMRVKQEGLENDLLERLQADADFHPPALKHELDWEGLMDPMKYIGRSVEQTERFVKEVVEPLREQYADEIAKLGGSDRGV